MANWDDDDEDEDGFDVEEDEEDEDDEDDDESESVADVEADYRRHRARIRACQDLSELRQMRGSLLATLRRGGLGPAVTLRMNDLVEHVDDRITDLKAAALARQRE